MRILIKKAKKAFVEELNRDVIVSKAATYYVNDISKDFSCKEGIIKKKDLQNTSGIVKTTKEVEFIIIPQQFIDQYHGLPRLAQTIHSKDMGAIITETGLNKNSVIAEAGTGSAGLSCFLANIVKKIHSFDINEKHLEMAKKNIASMKLKNIAIKIHDIYTSAPCKNMDTFILDVPAPWKALPHLLNTVKIGGFIVNYSPNIPQVSQFIAALPENALHIKTIAVSHQPWKIGTDIAKPTTPTVAHTAFLTFIRRIQ